MCMMPRRGAPRLTEREDPLSFVLRNTAARKVLERLDGNPIMIPIELRKSVGLHPETFRRLISDLDEFALIGVRALPGQQRLGRKRSAIFSVRIGIEITRSGSKVLHIANLVRATVRRHAGDLPPVSLEHWVPTSGS